MSRRSFNPLINGAACTLQWGRPTMERFSGSGAAGQQTKSDPRGHDVYEAQRWLGSHRDGSSAHRRGTLKFLRSAPRVNTKERTRAVELGLAPREVRSTRGTAKIARPSMDLSTRVDFPCARVYLVAYLGRLVRHQERLWQNGNYRNQRQSPRNPGGSGGP